MKKSNFNAYLDTLKKDCPEGHVIAVLNEKPKLPSGKLTILEDENETNKEELL